MRLVCGGSNAPKHESLLLKGDHRRLAIRVQRGQTEETVGRPDACALCQATGRETKYRYRRTLNRSTTESGGTSSARFATWAISQIDLRTSGLGGQCVLWNFLHMGRLAAPRWRCAGSMNSIASFAAWADGIASIVELVVAATEQRDRITTGAKPTCVVPFRAGVAGCPIQKVYWNDREMQLKVNRCSWHESYPFRFGPWR